MTRQLARAMPSADMCFLLSDNKQLVIRARPWQRRWQLDGLPIGYDGSGWQSGFGLRAAGVMFSDFFSVFALCHLFGGRTGTD